MAKKPAPKKAAKPAKKAAKPAPKKAAKAAPKKTVKAAPKKVAKVAPKKVVKAAPKNMRAQTICRMGMPPWPRNLAQTSKSGSTPMATTISATPRSVAFCSKRLSFPNPGSAHPTRCCGFGRGRPPAPQIRVKPLIPAPSQA